jgi:hypothetical protein
MPLFSRPLLPPDLVKKIKSDDMMSGFESEIYSQHFHENRLLMRNWEAPYSPDSFVIQDLGVGFTADMKRTPLHLAAYDGDVLAAYEVLGLGATADKADSSGITPICLAISHLAMVTSPHIRGFRPDGVPLDAADFEKEASRLKLVIRILVEQHVALNASMDGEPLINLLCRSRAWDTIALFLEHGAASPTNVTALFRTAADRSRFASLLKGQPKIRPARKCPCWSGKTVLECHAKAQPYPLGYVCVCGSGKTYQKCCFSRKSYVVEKWHPTLKRIMHDYDRSQNPVMKAIQSAKDLKQAMAQAIGVELEDRPLDFKPDMMKAFIKTLVADTHRLLDPAFTYALSRVDFIPRSVDYPFMLWIY